MTLNTLEDVKWISKVKSLWSILELSLSSNPISTQRNSMSNACLGFSFSFGGNFTVIILSIPSKGSSSVGTLFKTPPSTNL